MLNSHAPPQTSPRCRTEEWVFNYCRGSAPRGGDPAHGANETNTQRTGYAVNITDSGPGGVADVSDGSFILLQHGIEPICPDSLSRRSNRIGLQADLMGAHMASAISNLTGDPVKAGDHTDIRVYLESGTTATTDPPNRFLTTMTDRWLMVLRTWLLLLPSILN